MNNIDKLIEVCLGDLVVRNNFKSSHLIRTTPEAAYTSVITSLQVLIPELHSLHFLRNYRSKFIYEFEGDNSAEYLKIEIRKNLTTLSKRNVIQNIYQTCSKLNFKYNINLVYFVPVNDIVPASEIGGFFTSNKSLSTTLADGITVNGLSLSGYSSSGNESSITAFTKDKCNFARRVINKYKEINEELVSNQICTSSFLNVARNSIPSISHTKIVTPTGSPVKANNQRKLADFYAIADEKSIGRSPVFAEMEKEKALFSYELYTFIEQIMIYDHTYCNLLVEEWPDFSAISRTIEICFNIGDYQFHYLDEILELLKRYFNYSFIKKIRKEEFKLENDEILSVEIISTIVEFFDRLVNRAIGETSFNRFVKTSDINVCISAFKLEDEMHLYTLEDRLTSECSRIFHETISENDLFDKNVPEVLSYIMPNAEIIGVKKWTYIINGVFIKDNEEFVNFRYYNLPVFCDVLKFVKSLLLEQQVDSQD